MGQGPAGLGLCGEWKPVCGREHTPPPHLGSMEKAWAPYLFWQQLPPHPGLAHQPWLLPPISGPWGAMHVIPRTPLFLALSHRGSDGPPWL